MTRAWWAIGALACAPPPSHPVVLPDAQDGLTVMATSSDDYTVGALTVVGVSDHATADVAAIHSDAVLSIEPDPDRPGEAIVWEINRLNGDTIRRYTPGVWDHPVWEASVGAGANPQDAATCQGRLFVSLYERADLAILSPATGESLGSVDLSSLADDDGLPELAGLFVQDDRLYVVAQRLDRLHGWSTDPGGKLAEVDCTTGAVLDRWDLGPDPELGGRGLATFASTDGVRTFADGAVTQTSAGVVDGAQVVDLAVGADGLGAFIARDGSTHVIGCVDTTTDPWTLNPLQSMAHYVSDVAVQGGQAWFAVRRGWDDPSDPGGVMVVDLATCTAADHDWIQSTWAPFSLGFVPCVGDACALPGAGTGGS